MSEDTSTEEDVVYPQGKEDEIQKLEGRLKDYELPKNVAIIGPKRVGKSSFINSVIASFSPKCWRERTLVGSFGGRGEQATRYLSRITKDEYLDSERQKSYPYPTLIDMDGFDDESSDRIKEQLRYVLFGIVPHEHTIEDTIRMHEGKEGKGILEAYKHTKKPLKVDCIIFVASSDSVLPYNLIEAVKQVALKEKRVIPVFGVLTKKDKCNKRTCNPDEFCSELGLQENRFLLCTNYCDDYDREKGQSRRNQVYPELDAPILEFMTQVCDPAIKVIQDDALPERSQSSDSESILTNVATALAFVGLVVLLNWLEKR